jgi:hypothetical protein
VNEDRNAELVDLGPERVKLRIADLVAGHVAADGGAAQAVLLDAFFELFSGELGMLQGDRRERDEAVGIRRARFGELLVLDLTDPLREIAVRVVPARVDAERFDVDALLVHRAQSHADFARHVEIRA